MSAGSLDTVAERIEAAGCVADRVTAPELGDAIRAAADPPTVATPTAPLDRILDRDAVSVDPTGAELTAAVTGVTLAEAALTESGSLVLAAFGSGSSLLSVFVERHIAVVGEADVLADVGDVLGMLERDELGSCILATGPSATADMGELVQGAHGPATVRVLLVEGELG